MKLVGAKRIARELESLGLDAPVSKWVVYRLEKNAGLPVARFGGRLIADRNAVIAWWEAQGEAFDIELTGTGEE